MIRDSAMWPYAVAAYLVIVLLTAAFMVRLNIALMRDLEGRLGRWDTEDVGWIIILAALWPVSLVLLWRH